MRYKNVRFTYLVTYLLRCIFVLHIFYCIVRLPISYFIEHFCFFSLCIFVCILCILFHLLPFGVINDDDE